MNFEDPGFLGALVGAAAGLLGAGIGGAATYWAAKIGFNTEYNYKKWDALRAVLRELSGNYHSMILDLDRALPAWLARSHRRGGVPEKTLRDYVGQTARYRNMVFDRLFSELVSSKFGSELTSYYERVAWLNDWTSRSATVDIVGYFDDYIFSLANNIEAADDLIEAIDAECRGSPVQPWGKNLDMETVKSFRTRARLLAKLAKHDLDSIEKTLTGSAQLSAYERATFEEYASAARECSAW
jgi:hypothetical protein